MVGYSLKARKYIGYFLLWNYNIFARINVKNRNISKNRYHPTKLIVKKMGEDVNIEKGATFE